MPSEVIQIGFCLLYLYQVLLGKSKLYFLVLSPTPQENKKYDFPRGQIDSVLSVGNLHT